MSVTVDVFEFNGTVCHCPDGWSLVLVCTESVIPQCADLSCTVNADGRITQPSYHINSKDRDVVFVVPPSHPRTYHQVRDFCRRGERQGAISVIVDSEAVYEDFTARLSSDKESSVKVTGWKKHVCSAWESELLKAVKKDDCPDFFIITNSSEGLSFAVGDEVDDDPCFCTENAVELLMWAKDNGCTIEWH